MTQTAARKRTIRSTSTSPAKPRLSAAEKRRRAAERKAIALLRKVIESCPTDEGWRAAELATAILRGEATAASCGALCLVEPPMEKGGLFPAGPVIFLMQRFLHERRWTADQLAQLLVVDASFVRAILSHKRRTLKLNTVDRMLMAMDMPGEWHRSLAPYWLDEAAQAEIDELDMDEALAA